ncbi:MAG: cell division protein ZapE [Alphaproteobacteria bacterium]|nr:cell division protein ZapE [Alphaproteobacteria bacterium]
MRKKKQAAAPQNDSPILAAYEARVAAGLIHDDEAQRNVIAQLERTLAYLRESGGAFHKFFGLGLPPEEKTNIYIWGSVGRGKSMVMDLFFEAAPTANKRRVHFHAFMQEVHKRLHNYRQNKNGVDPVMALARDIATETSLLCFDELQATDVADATLLYRLFEGLFQAGVVVVSTSNHPPASLYTGGIQRERFNKFVTLLKEQMQVISLRSPSDYRYMQLRSLQKTYHAGSGAEAFIKEVLEHMNAGDDPEYDLLVVQGRSLSFMLYGKNIGRFTFRELCEKPLGAADYLALANRLDTVILTDIPTLPAEKRNEAKRFVTLIDTLYERKIKLICTASGAPETIYGEGDGSFEFARTVSRLVEMQSANYLEETQS